MTNLCSEASMNPVREIKDIRNIDPSQIRPTQYLDFIEALRMVKKSVS